MVYGCHGEDRLPQVDRGFPGEVWEGDFDEFMGIFGGGRLWVGSFFGDFWAQSTDIMGCSMLFAATEYR